MPTVDPIAEPSPAEREAIPAPLDAFSRVQGFVRQPDLLALALRVDAGRTTGGAIGETNWGRLRVWILAVSEKLRGEGRGSRLIHELERLGYRVFGVPPDYPTGHERYFLCKPLGAGAP